MDGIDTVNSGGMDFIGDDINQRTENPHRLNKQEYSNLKVVYS